MMNDLLKNEEVRRLFSCREHGHLDLGDGCLSKNILDGMYAPIAEGELYYDPQAKAIIKAYAGISTTYHPYLIRLPDWNQKPRHEHKFVCECGTGPSNDGLANKSSKDVMDRLAGLRSPSSPDQWMGNIPHASKDLGCCQ